METLLWAGQVPEGVNSQSRRLKAIGTVSMGQAKCHSLPKTPLMMLFLSQVKALEMGMMVAVVAVAAHTSFMILMIPLQAEIPPY